MRTGVPASATTLAVTLFGHVGHASPWSDASASASKHLFGISAHGGGDGGGGDGGGDGGGLGGGGDGGGGDGGGDGGGLGGGDGGELGAGGQVVPTQNLAMNSGHDAVLSTWLPSSGCRAGASCSCRAGTSGRACRGAGALTRAGRGAGGT